MRRTLQAAVLLGSGVTSLNARPVRVSSARAETVIPPECRPSCASVSEYLEYLEDKDSGFHPKTCCTLNFQETFFRCIECIASPAKEELDNACLTQQCAVWGQTTTTSEQPPVSHIQSMITSASSNASPSSSANSTNSSTASVGLIVGLVVGLPAALLLVGAMIVLRCRRMRERHPTATPYPQADAAAELNASSPKKQLSRAYDDSLTLADSDTSESDSDSGSSTTSDRIWEDRIRDAANAESQLHDPRREPVVVRHSDSGWRPPPNRKQSSQYYPENVVVLDLPPEYEEAL